jgi:hypothetical protein
MDRGRAGGGGNCGDPEVVQGILRERGDLLDILALLLEAPDPEVSGLVLQVLEMVHRCGPPQGLGSGSPAVMAAMQSLQTGRHLHWSLPVSQSLPFPAIQIFSNAAMGQICGIVRSGLDRHDMKIGGSALVGYVHFQQSVGNVQEKCGAQLKRVHRTVIYRLDGRLLMSLCTCWRSVQRSMTTCKLP